MDQMPWPAKRMCRVLIYMFDPIPDPDPLKAHAKFMRGDVVKVVEDGVRMGRDPEGKGEHGSRWMILEFPGVAASTVISTGVTDYENETNLITAFGRDTWPRIKKLDIATLEGLIGAVLTGGTTLTFTKAADFNKFTQHFLTKVATSTTS